MATMFPESHEDFLTEGEKEFFHFVRDTAKPDSRFLCWYTPNIEGREPDFLLYGLDMGIVVLEVKDWAIDQITGMDRHTVDFVTGKKEEKRKNPFRQAEEYMYSLKSLITKDGRFTYRDGKNFGKSKLPVSCGVVFPNIYRETFEERGYHTILDSEKVFFLDDLHYASELRHDNSGGRFRERILEKFPPLFPCCISGAELLHLGGLIHPEVRIALPERGRTPEYAQLVERIRQLDHRQELAARKYDGGHRIIAGPSGCGKTLVLVSKAAFLLKYNNRRIKKILFVCYNITLVRYIRRLLSEKGVPLGDGGVEVMHFYELCEKIIGEKIPFEGEESGMYELYLQDALEKLPSCGLQYDAILVDEGQDFSDDMYRIVTGLLNKETDNLTIALDRGQDIYRPKSSWRSVGVKAKGRVHSLPHVYRNTREIAEFAARACDRDIPAYNTSNSQGELFDNIYIMSGPPPMVKVLPSTEKCISFVADTAATLLEEEKYSPSEIAVLYTKSTPGGEDSVHIPRAIEQALSLKGILSQWVTEGYAAKRAYDITTESVAISTIHSAKGMDYGCVFLLGLEFLDGSRWSSEQIKSLAYVGITRARHQLFIPCCTETQTIKKFSVALKT